MGRDNRRRRAAKQKIRARRGPTPPRSTSPRSTTAGATGFGGPADEFAELFDDSELFDPTEGAGAGGPASSTGPRLRPSTVTERAQRLLDDWIAAAWRQTDAQVLRRWAEHQLVGVDDDVLLRADELLANRLLADLAHLWTRGWQPRDLLHVSQRIDKRATVLAAGLIVHQLRRSGRFDLAPDGWRQQLETAERRARDGGLRPVEGAWTPIDRLLATGAGLAEALVSTLQLQVRITQLPPLAMTLPPPASWRPAERTSQPQPAPPHSGPRHTRQPGTDTSDARRDKVLVKIRALLAKAESTDHAAEAETFTAKAQDLMTRHAIDEALLHAGVQESVEVRSRRVLIDNPYPLEKVRLLNEVALANRVKVIWADDLAIATAVGTPVDIDQVEMLFISLLIQATRAMAEAGASRAGSFDRSPTFRRSFLTSYAIRIGERLRDADAEATASYGSALVPVLKRQREAVEEEFERLFPDIRHVSSRRSYDRRGWEAGREAADRASFVAGRIAG